MLVYTGVLGSVRTGIDSGHSPFVHGSGIRDERAIFSFRPSVYELLCS